MQLLDQLNSIYIGDCIYWRGLGGKIPLAAKIMGAERYKYYTNICEWLQQNIVFVIKDGIKHRKVTSP